MGWWLVVRVQCQNWQGSEDGHTNMHGDTGASRSNLCTQVSNCARQLTSLIGPSHGMQTTFCMLAGLVCSAAKHACTIHRMPSLHGVCGAAGVQTGVVSLEGPIVALAAKGHQLALVWHSGNPLGKSQTLSAAQWDVAEQAQVGGRWGERGGRVCMWLYGCVRVRACA